jgi:hypothetical protein
MRSELSFCVAGVLTAAGLVLCANRAAGDVIELKNGTRLNGTYAGGTGDKIRFMTPEGIREIGRNEAASLTFTGPPAPPPPSPAPPPTAVPAAAVSAGSTASTTIPAGSLLLVRMLNQVTSNDREGTKFSAVLETNLMAGDAIVAPAGTKVFGQVEKSKQAGRMVGKSKLQLGLTDINLGGTNVPIQTSDFAEAGQSSFKKTVRNTAVGAGVGSVFGEAGAGAAVGAGVSVIRKGESVTVPPNAILEFRLVQPINVKVVR